MNINDFTIISIVVASIVFFLMGIPLLIGMLLRFLLKRPPARLVAIIAAVGVSGSHLDYRFR